MLVNWLARVNEIEAKLKLTSTPWLGSHGGIAPFGGLQDDGPDGRAQDEVGGREESRQGEGGRGGGTLHPQPKGYGGWQRQLSWD